MIKKNKFYLMNIFLIVIILFMGIGFVNPDIIITEKTSTGESKTPSSIGGIGEIKFSKEEVDIGAELMGRPEGEITAKGVEYQPLNEEGGVHLVFKEEGARVDFNGDIFKNIIPQDVAGHPTFIDVDKEGNIVRTDFTVNEEGGTYFFGNTKIEVPPNSRVFFDKETGIIRIKSPEGSEITEIPTKKDSSLPSEHITTIEGENIKLPGGNTFSGKLNYDNKQAFVNLGDKKIINGVEIILASEKTNIFFDGQKHKGSYTSFGDTNLIISSNGNSDTQIKFEKGNRYLTIDEEREGEDYVGMNTHQGGEIEIQNRDSQGLIPRVTTKGPFIIDEDSKHIVNIGDKVFLKKFSLLSSYKKSLGTTTSPIELFVQDKDGNNLLTENSKIYVDNFNRIVIGPDVKEFISSSEGIDIKLSTRIKYNYPTEESIEKLTGVKLILDGLPQGKKDEVLGRLRDYWKTLTPETKDSVRDLNVLGDDPLEKFISKRYPSMGSKKYWDFAAFAEYDGSIYFRSNSFNFENLRHETGHTRLFKIDGEKFKADWNQISGSPYIGDDYPKISNSESLSLGLCRPYGGFNYLEDVSTCIEKVVGNPEFFAELINSESNKYDVRYKQKLDLLHKDRFISDQEYNNILGKVERGIR